VLLATSLALVLPVAAGCSSGDTVAKRETWGTAGFTGFDLATHDRVGTAQLRGRPAMLVAWATWCGECRTELPALQRYYERMPASSPLQVVAVDVDTGGASYEVRKAAYEAGLTMPVWVDPRDRFRSTFGVFGVPSTVLLDSSGEVFRVLPGAVDLDDPDVRRTLAELVEGARGA
jgi:thiol-disulfide isomerase/thioredoxin